MEFYIKTSLLVKAARENDFVFFPAYEKRKRYFPFECKSVCSIIHLYYILI